MDPDGELIFSLLLAMVESCDEGTRMPVFTELHRKILYFLILKFNKNAANSFLIFLIQFFNFWVTLQVLELIKVL